MTLQKPRLYGTSKEAAARLVDAFPGGLRDAAQYARVSKSTLARYTDPQEPAEMPVDIVATLEAVAHCHPVTEWLAARGGFALLPMLAAPGAGALARDIARIGQEMAELMQAFADSQADGALDPDEARRMVREADEGMAALATLRSHCQAVVDEAETNR